MIDEDGDGSADDKNYGRVQMGVRPGLSTAHTSNIERIKQLFVKIAQCFKLCGCFIVKCINVFVAFRGSGQRCVRLHRLPTFAVIRLFPSALAVVASLGWDLATDPLRVSDAERGL